MRNDKPPGEGTPKRLSPTRPLSPRSRPLRTRPLLPHRADVAYALPLPGGEGRGEGELSILSHDEKMRPVVSDGNIVLAASTGELQEFILAHLSDKDFFGGTMEMKRKQSKH